MIRKNAKQLNTSIGNTMKVNGDHKKHPLWELSSTITGHPCSIPEEGEC